MSVILAAAQATTWRIDPAHTSVEFAVRHLMITNVKGRFGAVAGTVRLDPDHPRQAAVDVTIEAASIDTRNEQRDTHLRSSDFLHADRFATLRFVGATIEGDPEGAFTLAGDLTIRGVTRPVKLAVTSDGSARDPWGGERVSYSASTTIKRSEWGLTWNQALEAGGVVVGEDVKLSLDVQLVREEG